MADGRIGESARARVRVRPALAAGIALLLLFGAAELPSAEGTTSVAGPANATGRPVLPAASPLGNQLAKAAMAQVGVTTSYESAYMHLDYPGGDVAADTGMCADVVVRAFRAIRLDLQRAIQEDMSAHLEEYPQPFGLARPDANIDHRRVNNLQTYFARRGMRLPVSMDGSEYLPGDVVTWTVAGYPHVGIVSTEPALCRTRYQIAHNIGGGVRVEDVLFRFEITGHYRWR